MGKYCCRLVSVSEIVTRITNPNNPQSMDQSVLLWTFSLYCTKEDLLDVVLLRYNSPDVITKDDILKTKIKVIALIKHWIVQYQHEFVRNLQDRERIAKFKEKFSKSFAKPPVKSINAIKNSDNKDNNNEDKKDDTKTKKDTLDKNTDDSKTNSNTPSPPKTPTNGILPPLPNKPPPGKPPIYSQPLPTPPNAFGVYFRQKIDDLSSTDKEFAKLAKPVILELDRLDKGQIQSKRRQLIGLEQPSPLISSKIKNASDIELGKLHPQEVARQLCLLEYALFKEIPPHEFLAQSKKNRSGKKVQPNIRAMIDFFNKVVIWTQVEILSLPDASKRASMINTLIKICNSLEEFNNISSLCAIHTGLKSIPIHRLHKTWSQIGFRGKNSFSKLDQLFSLV